MASFPSRVPEAARIGNTPPLRKAVSSSGIASPCFPESTAHSPEVKLYFSKYTAVANVVVDYCMRDLSGSEFKVILSFIRDTIGQETAPQVLPSPGSSIASFITHSVPLALETSLLSSEPFGPFKNWRHSNYATEFRESERLTQGRQGKNYMPRRV